MFCHFKSVVSKVILGLAPVPCRQKGTEFREDFLGGFHGSGSVVEQLTSAHHCLVRTQFSGCN